MSKKFEALFDGSIGSSKTNGRWVEYEIIDDMEPQRSLGVMRAKASRYPSTHVNDAGDKVIFEGFCFGKLARKTPINARAAPTGFRV